MKIEKNDVSRTSSARLIGLMAALATSALFVYPARAFPLQNLIFVSVLFVMGLGLMFSHWTHSREVFSKVIGQPAVLAVAGSACWVLFRWRGLTVPSLDDPNIQVRITSHGRPTVIAYQLLIVGLLVGLGMSKIRESGSSVWRAFHRTLILAGLGFAFLGFYQYFYAYERDRTDLEASLKSPGVSVSPLMAQSLLHAFEEKRIGGRLGNGNIFAALLAVLAAFSLSEWKREHRPNAGRLFQVVSILAYGTMAGAILLTKSRGGLLTLVVGTVGGLRMLRCERSGNASSDGALKKSAGLVTLAFAWLACSPRLIQAGQSLWQRTANIGTIRERLFYWVVAIKVWRLNSPFGKGPGAFELFYPIFKLPQARESQYAHSWFFQLGAETGFVGVALFLVFWGIILKLWIIDCGPGGSRLKSQDSIREARWLGLGSLLLGFNGLFEYSLQTPEFLLLLGVLSGGFLGLTDQSHTRNLHKSAISNMVNIPFWVFPSASLLAAVWLFPRQQIAWFWEGEAKVMAQSGEHDRARRYFAKASAWMPDHEGYLASQAMALLASTPPDFAAVEKLLDQAVKLNPLSPRMRRNQAELLDRMGKKEEALKKLDEAVALYPYDAGYRLDRAGANLGLGRKDEARKDLEFIRDNQMPVWEYQRPILEKLKKNVGLEQE